MNNNDDSRKQEGKLKLVDLIQKAGKPLSSKEALEALERSRQSIDKQIFGKDHEPATRPSQQESIRVDTTVKEIGHDPIEEDKTFSTFEVKTKLHTEIMTALKRWNWSKKGMYIYGSYGSGKSHLMQAFRKNLFDREMLKGKRLRFFNTVTLLKYLKDFDPRNKDFGGESNHDFHMNLSKTVDMLILDDFGANRASEFEIDTLFDILDHRCRYRLVTFCTSNLSMNQVQSKFGTRIAERILEMMVVTECHTNESHRWKIQRDSRK